MRETSKVRVLLWLSAIAGSVLAAQVVWGCNDSPLIEVPVCRPGLCTCEEDPQQATCKGFNERPEGGKDPADAKIPETSPDDAPDDAPADAPDDAEDAAD